MCKCSCRRMKCDEGSDAWNSLRISHIHVFLQNLRQHVPRKKNMEFAKVRRKKFFFGEDDVFQMKEFRTTFIYIYIHVLFNEPRGNKGIAAYRTTASREAKTTTPYSIESSWLPYSIHWKLFPQWVGICIYIYIHIVYVYMCVCACVSVSIFLFLNRYIYMIPWVFCDCVQRFL